MSNFENGMSSFEWKMHSNGLHKSSSLPDYIKLPIINYNNQTKYLGNELDRRNRIKDETLLTKKKLLKYRGLPENHTDHFFKDSWYDFHKRREKERERKRMHNLIVGERVLDTESDNDIFRNLDKSVPNIIEDKIKLKQYLPIKKDLAKLMMKINDNMQRKIDENNNIINQSLSNLDQGYNELKKLIVEKMDRLEMKQKHDFNNLNKYFEIKERRQRNKSLDNLIENGQNIYTKNGFNNYSEKERRENLELAQRIKNIPNLLDNMINDLETMKEKRNKQKMKFLHNLNNNINKELKEESNYDISDRNEEDYDEYESKDEVNDLNYYNNYTNNKYTKENNRYDNTYSNPYPYYNNNYNPNYNIQRKSRTEEFDNNSYKSYLTMSKTSIQKLKKKLKPLSHQNEIIKKNKSKEDTSLISGDELLKIYEEKNRNKKIYLAKKENNQKTKSVKNNETKSVKTNTINSVINQTPGGLY